METAQDNLFKNILDVLFKRKRLVIAFFLSTVLTAVAGVILLQKDTYEAYSKILIETNRGYVSDRSLPANDQRRTSAGLNMEQQVDLALQVLRDNATSSKVVEQIGATVIYPDLAELQEPQPAIIARLYDMLGLPPRESAPDEVLARIATVRLQDDIIVERAGRMSSIIYIAFRHENPFVAAEVVNTLVTLYVNRHLELRKKPRLTRFFQEQFEVKKTALAQAEQDLKAFKNSHAITSPPEVERSFIIAQVEKQKAQLDETMSQRAELQNEARQIRRQLARTAKNPRRINALMDKLVELQVREGELSTHYEDDFPEIQDIRGEIKRIQEQLDQLKSGKNYGTGALEEGSLYESLQERLLKTEVELNILEARESTLKNQLAAYNEQLRKLDGIELEFNTLASRLSTAQKSYRLYQTKFEEFRISDALDAEGIANVKVFETARPPIAPIPPKTNLILLLALIFGAIGGIGLALAIELIGGTLSKKEDTERYLKRPVLATIPDYSPATVARATDNEAAA